MMGGNKSNSQTIGIFWIKEVVYVRAGVIPVQLPWVFDKDKLNMWFIHGFQFSL